MLYITLIVCIALYKACEWAEDHYKMVDEEESL